MSDVPHPLLAELDEYRRSLEAAALDTDAELPSAPSIGGDATLGPADLAAAGELLTLIQATEERLTGLKMRVAGELAGIRRPKSSGLRPAPRTVDTSA